MLPSVFVYTVEGGDATQVVQTLNDWWRPVQDALETSTPVYGDDPRGFPSAEERHGWELVGGEWVLRSTETVRIAAG